MSDKVKTGIDALREHFKEAARMTDDRHRPRPIPEDGHPKATMELEQRPSLVASLSPGASPISFWVVLRYKHHVFDRMLPDGFMGMDDAARDLVIADAAGELQRQLRPIMLAEDRDSRLVGP